MGLIVYVMKKWNGTEMSAHGKTTLNIGKHYSIVKQYVLVLDYTQLHFTDLLFETNADLVCFDFISNLMVA